MPRSCSAFTACGMQARIGMPTCSMNTSCVAAVPPCMPSSTTTSAPAFTAKRGVIIGPRAADLDVDRLFPIGDLADFQDLDFQIIRAGPVGVAAGRALVNPFGKVAHLGDAVADFLTQQHAAAAGFGALPHDDFDAVRAAQVVGVHAVTAREDIDRPALREWPRSSSVMPPSPVVVAGARRRCAASQAPLSPGRTARQSSCRQW